MKTIKKLFLILIMAVPIMVLGQTTIYDFDTKPTTYTTSYSITTTGSDPLSISQNNVTNGAQASATYSGASIGVPSGLASPTNTTQALSLNNGNADRGYTLDLPSIPQTSLSYSVQWTQWIRSNTSPRIVGILLGGSSSTSTTNTSSQNVAGVTGINTYDYTGIRAGYAIFAKISGTTNGTSSLTFYIYQVGVSGGSASFTQLGTSATVSSLTINGSANGIIFRATCQNYTVKIEYSLDSGSTFSTGATYTNSGVTLTKGVTQLLYGSPKPAAGTGSCYSWVDDIKYTALTSASSVTISGNSKYVYTGSPQGPNSATTALFSGTPTTTYTYTGIGGTAYATSSTQPSAAGTYKVVATSTYLTETATDTKAFEIIPNTFDQLYTFNNDGTGSAAANTTYTGYNHTVQSFTGTVNGYTSIGKMLQPSNQLSQTELTNFGTSTNYSVTWKEYYVATGAKNGVILRASGVTNGSTIYGDGYLFYVYHNTSNLQLDIRKLSASPTAPSALVSTSSLSNATANAAMWYRATANGSSLKFEYSTDGTTWSTAVSTTDASYSSGTTLVIGINSAGTNHYFDYFGYIDLTKYVTADDNKFIYTGSALTPTVSYPGFTTPVATLTYTGTGSTSYSGGSTAPTQVGTYSLAVSVTENGTGVPRTGTFGFEIVPNTYDNIYTFKTDATGNTPAGISYAQGATSGTGVVASYSGTDNGSSATALTFHPTGLGSVGNTGVADLTSIASSSSYSVTWKEYITGNSYKKGFLLQGQAGACPYANDLKQGYLFIVYNDATNGTKCRIYKTDAVGVGSPTENANSSVANPASGVARWYRASVSFGLQKFEYSDNGTTWFTATKTHDLTYAGLSGSTQLVYGLAAGVGNYYYDYIASKAYTALSTTGGNWSSISWASTPGLNSDITLTSGELVVDNSQSVNSIVVSPGAKLTINTGRTLSASSITLQSSSSGTATFVDSDPTGSTISGSVQQYLPIGRNWYVGIPFTDASAVNSSTLLSAGATSVSHWNEATGAWVNTYSGAMSRGKGFIAVSASGSATNNISFSGTLNTGSVPVTVTRTVGVTKEGFNLIANPYPSYLNPCAVITASAKMESTIWYRTKGTSYSFETVNTASGEGTNGVTGYIPPMQAFWVRVKPNSVDALQNNSETLTFNNTMRYHANPTVGQTTITTTVMKAPSAAKSVTSRLRLVVSNGINSDEALIYTNSNAANGYDIYDSQKMTNGNKTIPEICTLVGDENLVINGLNSIQPNMEIPLGFTTGQSNTFTIKASEISNFGAGTSIILRDSKLNTEQELTTSNAYSFSSDSISTTSRFSIIFKTSSVTTGVNSTDNNQPIEIYRNADNQITVSCGNNLNNNAVAIIYNALGQRLASKQLLGSKTVFENQFNSGVYLVYINNGGKVTTSKIKLN